MCSRQDVLHTLGLKDFGLFLALKALTLSSVSAQSSYAYYAASFFSALRFYFYYFFAFIYPSKRKLVS